MSLSKQLLILISFLFFIVFSVNFVLTMNNIKSYLEVESELHMQNTATSLGLSLSPYMSRERDPMVRTMMNAIFDMGYYKEMRLVDVDGKELVTLTNHNQSAHVPGWLIKLMPMKAATAYTEINSGWSISGTLSVSTNPSYGYLKLYEQGTETLKYSLLIFVLAIISLSLVLQFTLKSLKEIEAQADDIASGKFTIIKKLPWTLEVRNVASSMNDMSNKIGSMIDRLHKKLDALTENLKRDPLTSLFNEAQFKEDLHQTLSNGNVGYAALVKLDDLAGIVKLQGNSKANELIKKFADILKTAADTKGITPYRLHGSEFALLFEDYHSEQMSSFSASLQQQITSLGLHYGIDDIAHTGIISFNRASEISKLLPAMNEAYKQAKNIGPNAYFIQDKSISAMKELAWRKTIVNVINNDTPEITLTSEAFNYKEPTPSKVMEEAFTVVKDEYGNNLSIGTFFSMAREFGLEEEIDKCIINNIITLIELTGNTNPVIINLSINSVTSATFTSWLKSRLDKTEIEHSLLVFSVSAYAVAKQLDGFANFSIFAHSLGAKTLVKRYSSDVIPLDLLKKLHVDYIRLARELTTDIASNKDKSDLLDILQEVTDLLNIKVIAVDVKNDADFNLVRNSTIYGIGR